jgi:SAM-dependent methyltransferase
MDVPAASLPPRPPPLYTRIVTGQRYGVYDEFAWCYSRGWAGEYHLQATEAFEQHVFPRLPLGARILDLCCGCGELAAVLLDHGWLVTGIDGSEQMLEYACARAPGAEFLIEDARSFDIEDRFEAAFSTFDSLNHILSLDELECVFRNVHRALAADGLFVFDLNMSESFETLWRGSFSSVEDDCASITRGSYDPEARLGCAAVTMFRLEDGLWKRSDVEVRERCYSEEDVRGRLEAAGFRNIRREDAYELGMRGDIALGRAFFFAEK